MLCHDRRYLCSPFYPKSGGGYVFVFQKGSLAMRSQGIGHAICTMTSFDYYYQNSSGFCFLVQIRAFFI